MRDEFSHEDNIRVIGFAFQVLGGVVREKIRNSEKLPSLLNFVSTGMTMAVM